MRRCTREHPRPLTGWQRIAKRIVTITWARQTLRSSGQNVKTGATSSYRATFSKAKFRITIFVAIQIKTVVELGVSPRRDFIWEPFCSSWKAKWNYEIYFSMKLLIFTTVSLIKLSQVVKYMWPLISFGREHYPLFCTRGYTVDKR